MDEVLAWLSQSEYDLGTAQVMFDSGRYIYAVFMSHLAVEKALKALVVKRTGNAPPRVHNLVQLVGLARPDLTPDEVKALTDYPPAVVQEYVGKAREIVECLKKQAS